MHLSLQKEYSSDGDDLLIQGLSLKSGVVDREPRAPAPAIVPSWGLSNPENQAEHQLQEEKEGPHSS